MVEDCAFIHGLLIPTELERRSIGVKGCQDEAVFSEVDGI